MKRLMLLAASVAIASAAQAQTQVPKKKNKTAIPASVQVAQNSASVASNSSAPAVAAASTSTSQLDQVSSDAKKDEKKLSAVAVLQTSAGLNDISVKHSDSYVASVNYVGVGYQVNPDYKVGVRHYFQYVSNLKNASDQTKSDFAARGWETGYTTLDPALSLSTKIKNAPVTVLYYVPVTKFSQDSKKMGTLRADTDIAWELSPKVSIDYVPSLRLTGYTSSKDALVRLIHSVGPTYNFNDNFSVYSSIGMDQTGIGLNPRASADSVELEVGANVQLGPVIINPAITESKNTNHFQLADIGRADADAVAGNDGASFVLTVQAVW